MTDRQSHHDGRGHDGDAAIGTRFESGLQQLREDTRVYNEAVGSYNTHLDNHRERRDLTSVDFRDPLCAHEAYDRALEGDRTALRALLTHLIEEEMRDSLVRRHPRAYPIHREAVEHLSIERDQVRRTIEETLYHLNDEAGTVPCPGSD